MNRRTRWICSLVAAAALAAPAVLRAYPAPRDISTSGNQQRDQRDNQNHGRFYDQANRDWHDWNDNEDRAYRAFLAENRKEYREFSRLNDREQAEYWRWRHAHPDRDDRGRGDDRRGGPGRYYDSNGRDWHDWNDNEELAYRRFLSESHRDYREFGRLDDRDQAEYWRWRHNHPEYNQITGNNGPGNQGGRRYYDQNTGAWHDWDDHEDRAYRRFLDENHHAYVEFGSADLGLQMQFWLWRKFHNDVGDEPPRRFYDNDRREWHDWDEREERAYRLFIASNSRTYIEFSAAPPNFQVQYWAWRREHPDQDDRGYKRYFDPGHNDSHVWDDNEERAYRTFMKGRNWPYRELSILNPKDQQRYWDWRHQHPDRR